MDDGESCRTMWTYLVPLTAAAKSLQSCPTLCDPRDSSHQAPPSLGFSRQEYWSGLPFPSPMQEREKWKWSCSVMSNSWRPHGLQPTRLCRPWDFPGKSTGVGCHRLLRSRADMMTNWSLFVKCLVRCPMPRESHVGCDTEGSRGSGYCLLTFWHTSGKAPWMSRGSWETLRTGGRLL